MRYLGHGRVIISSAMRAPSPEANDSRPGALSAFKKSLGPCDAIVASPPPLHCEARGGRGGNGEAPMPSTPRTNRASSGCGGRFYRLRRDTVNGMSKDRGFRTVSRVVRWWSSAR
jgi:hypothetical protein